MNMVTEQTKVHIPQRFKKKEADLYELSVKLLFSKDKSFVERLHALQIANSYNFFPIGNFKLIKKI